METKTIDVLQSQPSLSDLLSFIAAGHIVILTEDGQPLAKLVPLQSPLKRRVAANAAHIQSSQKSRVAGLHSGAIQISEDFDEPLPDEFWMGEE